MATGTASARDLNRDLSRFSNPTPIVDRLGREKFKDRDDGAASCQLLNHFVYKEEIIKDYSKYKYGDFKMIQMFSNQMVTMIKNYYGESLQKTPDEWAIVIPPYGSIPSSIYPLAENIAHQLNLNLITTHVGKDNPNSYSALKTKKERIAARIATDAYLNEKASIKNLKIIFIDDLVTTGATIDHIKNLLLNTYFAKEVNVFTIARLNTEEPEYEEKINTYLVDHFDIKELITILNDANTKTNRHTLKTILNMESEKLGIVLSSLSNKELIKILPKKD